MTDDFNLLFKHESQLADITGESQIQTYKDGKKVGLSVIHKKSHVAEKGDQLGLDEYFNQFKIKGKRLRHVDKIEGKVLFIGV